MPDLVLLAFAGVALLLAGTVKGFLGIGMPTVALALLTLQLDARSAVSLVLVPMLFSNLWQFWRGPDMAGCIRTHWRYALVLMVFVASSVWLSQSAPDRFLRFVMGVFILIFCLLSWRTTMPVIPAHRLRQVEISSATIAGIVGGLTATWAPPMVFYLSALRLSRDDFVQTLGFLITAGSVSLVITYPSVGHMSGSDIVLSSGLLVPALLGFSVGERLRHRTDPERFRKIFLIGFAVLGLNLLLRSLLSA